MEITDVKNYLDKLESHYQREKGKLDQLKIKKKEKESELEKWKLETEKIHIQKILLKEASDEARKQAIASIEGMATRALQFIIGDHVSLHIELKEKAGNPAVEFYIHVKEKDKIFETDPVNEQGGGIADIVSFSLFIAILELTSKNKNLAPLFLDEPSKFVSKGYSEQVAKFLYEMSSYFNRQTVMITHDELLAQIGDSSYRFFLKDGFTHIEKVS